MRMIIDEDIDDMALGATLLGTGGGGDPYIAKLMVKQAIEKYGPIEVVEPAELPPDGLVMTSAVIGAPTVILERSLGHGVQAPRWRWPSTWARSRWR